MNLSKVYRGEEVSDLKQFRFHSFGDTEPGGPPEMAEGMTPGAAPPGHDQEQHTAHQVQEAFTRGRQEGLVAAEARLESTVQALAQVLEEVSRLRESLTRNSSQDMLRMVMAIAEQVVRREIEVDRSVVQSIIESALQASVRADAYHIRVSPADLESVTKQKPLFLASISGLQNITIEVDPAISLGGCRVESELGDVDATIESQLEAIREALAGAISEGR